MQCRRDLWILEGWGHGEFHRENLSLVLRVYISWQGSRGADSCQKRNQMQKHLRVSDLIRALVALNNSGRSGVCRVSTPMNTGSKVWKMLLAVFSLKTPK